MPRTPPELSGYCANNSILLQFILYDLAIAFSLCNETYKLMTPTNQKFTQTYINRFDAMSANIISLAGQPHKLACPFDWSLQEGVLAKIKRYASCYSNNLDASDTLATSLIRSANSAWLDSLACLDHFRELKRLMPFEKATPDTKLFEKIAKALKKLAKAVEKILLQFRDDENVLLFLLRHKERLAPLFEPHFLINLFKNIFPQGPEHARAFLVQRYAARGFPHLLPFINQKLHEVYS